MYFDHHHDDDGHDDVQINDTSLRNILMEMFQTPSTTSTTSSATPAAAIYNTASSAFAPTATASPPAAAVFRTQHHHRPRRQHGLIRPDEVEEIIYNYSRNQRMYHDNMRALIDLLVQDGAASSSSSSSAPRPTTTTTTTTIHHTAQQPGSSSSAALSHTENENDAVALILPNTNANTTTELESDIERNENFIISYFRRIPPPLPAATAPSPPGGGGLTYPPLSLTPAEINRAVRQFVFCSDSVLPPEEIICAISHEPFVHGDDIAEIIACGHKFKPALLLEWFARSSTCPVCRHNIRAPPVASIPF